MKKPDSRTWTVYVLLSDSTANTYVGSTINAQRRLRQHNGELSGGAKRTRAGRPWKLAKVYGPFGSRGAAQKVEQKIKKLRGKERFSYKEVIALR